MLHTWAADAMLTRPFATANIIGANYYPDA